MVKKGSCCSQRVRHIVVIMIMIIMMMIMIMMMMIKIMIMMPCDGEEGVVLLPESEAHLVVFVVVGLTVPPVEPGQY